MPESPSEKSQLVPRQYLVAFALVTSLFALWGFANDVTNPLVKVFKEIFQLTNTQSSLVQTAFYGGYALMAIPAALVIRKFSYKTGVMLGLILYASGALLFIPASATRAYGLFLLAYVVITSGLSFLETTANPYILSMGPRETATRRLNFAQAFNPLGSLTGMMLMSLFILPQLDIDAFRKDYKADHPEFAEMNPSKVDEKVAAAFSDFTTNEPEEFQELQDHDLSFVRLPYLAMAGVLLVVIIAFAVVKMPDTGHEEEPIHILELLRRLATFRYLGGVIAQTFYVGAQIMCWTYIIHYGVMLLGMETAAANNWNIAAMVTFISGRWLGTLFLLPRVRPGIALGVLAVGGMMATAAAIFTPGTPGIVCVVAISLFMSLMFPTIYGIALEGLTPNDAKLGSAGLIMAIGGGSVMPPLQAKIIDSGDVALGGMTLEAVRASFFLPLGCFIVIAIYGFLVARLKSPQIDVA